MVSQRRKRASGIGSRCFDNRCSLTLATGEPPTDDSNLHADDCRRYEIVVSCSCSPGSVCRGRGRQLARVTGVQVSE